MTAVTTSRSYRAFISYSHADAFAARWLHRRLEGFVMPRRLVGQPGPRGPVAARLTPIFKDRDDLPAARDLTDEVRAALSASACLVVLASPSAAASRYVDQEIALFRAQHPDRPILVALWDGEPDAAFPSALRTAADGSTIEPLAADFRKDGDGRRLALLKLVAGIAGVDLDSLVQREAQRRLRRVTFVTAGAVIGMLAMGLLAAFAFSARAEAERQRAQAEGLVEFMLTDLRDKLKGVGRLDVLTSANQRALAYYEAQDLNRLPPPSLERRARLFEQMGVDSEKRGMLGTAHGFYREAYRTTSAQLAADPDDPDRIFAAAQGEYYLGHVAEMRRDFVSAQAAYRRYRDSARRLVAIAPQSPRSMMEMGYAENNLGIIDLLGFRQPDKAVRAFAAAEGWFAAARRKDPGRDAFAVEHANCLGWLADAELAAADPAAALRHRSAARTIFARLLAANPAHRDYAQRLVVTDRALAAIEVALGHRERAATILATAAETMDGFVASDPANANWREQAARIGVDRATLLLADGRPAAARALLATARATLLGPTRRLADDKDRREVADRIDALILRTRPSLQGGSHATANAR